MPGVCLWSDWQYKTQAGTLDYPFSHTDSCVTPLNFWLTDWSFFRFPFRFSAYEVHQVAQVARNPTFIKSLFRRLEERLSIFEFVSLHCTHSILSELPRQLCQSTEVCGKNTLFLHLIAYILGLSLIDICFCTEISIVLPQLLTFSAATASCCSFSFLPFSVCLLPNASHVLSLASGWFGGQQD